MIENIDNADPKVRILSRIQGEIFAESVEAGYDSLITRVPLTILAYNPGVYRGTKMHLLFFENCTKTHKPSTSMCLISKGLLYI